MKSLPKKHALRGASGVLFALLFTVGAAPLAAEELNRPFWEAFNETRSPSKEKFREANKSREILDVQLKARRTIEKSTQLIQGVYDEYHKRFLKAQAAVAESARKVQKAMPEEMKTGTMPVPPVVKRYQVLWEDLCKCQAADIKLHKRVNELFEKAREADKLTAQDKETADALAQLANDLGSGYAALEGGGTEKWLKDARSKVGGLEKRAAAYSKEATDKIENVIKRRAEEEAKKAAAEKAAAEKAAAEERHKELIAKEQAKARDAFEVVVFDLKCIEWERCIRRLTRLKEGMATREGKSAAEDEIKKIKCMEGVQKHFTKYAKGFRFKGKKGALLATVTEVDEKGLTFQKMKYERGKYVPDKKVTRVTWEDFYALKDQERKYSDFKGQFLGFMNQFINELVVDGRENTKISARDLSDHMLGVALTLKYLYRDQPGVDKFIPDLVRKAVKDFEPCRKWAVQWFPEVELPEAEDL